MAERRLLRLRARVPNQHAAARDAYCRKPGPGLAGAFSFHAAWRPVRQQPAPAVEVCPQKSCGGGLRRQG